MQQEGIRKVIAEQSLEGAIIFLHDMLQKMAADIEQIKQPAVPVYSEASKEEEV